MGGGRAIYDGAQDGKRIAAGRVGNVRVCMLCEARKVGCRQRMAIGSSATHGPSAGPGRGRWTSTLVAIFSVPPVGSEWKHCPFGPSPGLSGIKQTKAGL